MDKITYEKIVYEAYRYRGTVINETTLLEKHIEQIIADYFCGKQTSMSDELIAVLLSEKITFDSKRHTLKYVIDRAYPEFKIKHPSWFSDLEKIMQQRNIFAHYPLSTNIEAEREFLNGKIGFAKFKGDVSILYYSKHDIHNLTTMIIKYVSAFRKLIGLEELKNS
jgi:hypothetical protein